MSDMSHNHQKKIAVNSGSAHYISNEGSVLSTANVDFFQSHGF